jgi:peptide/nickel transport system ATP-binding protein
MSTAAAPRTPPLLELVNLTIRFGDLPPVVDGVSLTVAPGECLAIVGESGSGKTLTARSLLGLLPASATATTGAFRIAGSEVGGLSEAAWRRIRGRGIGLVSQDALLALDPLRRVGREVAEAIEVHGIPGEQPMKWAATRHRAAIRRQVESLLAAVAMPEPAERARQYPHQLSGGLRQRALIASALSAGPGLIVADEPTTALDVTVQAKILNLLRELKEAGLAIILVSHDIAVVSQLADRIVVMQHGRFVEQGQASAVLGNPQHSYTRALLAAVPTSDFRVSDSPAAGPNPPLAPIRQASPVLSFQNVGQDFRGESGARRKAVDDVSFEVFAGESLGIVGESGSGKTTLARLMMGFDRPTYGRILLDGLPWSELSERRRRPRRGAIQLVSQDPLSSFDPRFTVRRIVGEALARNERRDPGRSLRRIDAVLALLDDVGLSSDLVDRRPHELSGGQRQRVAIARALAANPRILVCDEPVSALDVQIQARILDLLAETRRRLGLTVVFVSHDLAVVGQISERVLVMKDGSLVESGVTAEVFAAPAHPFTRELVAAVPRVTR